MATKRDTVFIWITWLAKVMAGDQSCEWASWFKAHHENYLKAPSDFDNAKWKMEHTRRLRELRQERMKAGARVFLEGANEIRYTMPSGIVVAGKPDLISVESGHPTIYDVKTGQQKACNEVQVMLYMLLLPKSVPAYHGSCPSGCVLYSAGAVSIPPEAIDETFVKHFEYFVDVIGSEVPAMKAPSRSECRFCDVSKSECAERVDA